jgi:hypothetical protein
MLGSDPTARKDGIMRDLPEAMIRVPRHVALAFSI